GIADRRFPLAVVEFLPVRQEAEQELEIRVPECLSRPIARDSTGIERDLELIRDRCMSWREREDCLDVFELQTSLYIRLDQQLDEQKLCGELDAIRLDPY